MKQYIYKIEISLSELCMCMYLFKHRPIYIDFYISKNKKKKGYQLKSRGPWERFEMRAVGKGMEDGQ